jgi:hypothetical protein
MNTAETNSDVEAGMDKWERRQQLGEELTRLQMADVQSVIEHRKTIEEQNERQQAQYTNDIISVVAHRAEVEKHFAEMRALAKRDVEAMERIAVALEAIPAALAKPPLTFVPLRSEP